MPLDLKPALQRFLDHWQPDMAIFTESEIWPVTIMNLAERDIPRILVNARMSDRSFKRWKNASGIAEVLFENFSHVIAQSKMDAERFLNLGATPVDVSGNLKVDTDSLPYDELELLQLQKPIAGRPCWIACSTHEGEEEAVGRIHAQLKARMPNLLTVIVPRHPDRADAVAAMLEANDLKVARRSKGEEIDEEKDIYLGDTIGEMGLYLRLAQVAFVGKSLKSSGGQNPLEPAMTRTPIISGQAVHNFREAYNKLLAADAVRLVSDENMLAANVEYLLNNLEERERMALAASAALERMQGALNHTSKILDAYLFPLTIKRDLEEYN